MSQSELGPASTTFRGIRRRIHVGVLLLLLLAGCGTFAREPASTAVVVAQARRGSMPEVTHLSGQVHAGRRAAVSASVPGQVLRVAPREGDRVQAGETVIWLDTRQQEAQVRIQQAAANQARAQLDQLRAQFAMTEASRHSDVRKAQENLTQANLAIEEAQSRLESARVDMKRKEDLLKCKAVARADYETAVLSFHLSQDELATARSKAVQAREELRLAQVTARDQTVHESELMAAQAEVERSEASLEASRATLELMTLSAPISGTVTSRSADPGDTVSPGGESLLQIVDRTGAYVTAVVPQTDVSRLREGMQAEVVLAADPTNPLRARVKRLIPATDPQTSVVRLNLALETPPAGLVDQAPASIRVRVGARQGILVPLAALQGERPNLHVVLIRDGRARRVPVRVTMTDDSHALLAEGLTEGDTVVVEGGQFLSGGDPVQVLRTSHPGGPRPRQGLLRHGSRGLPARHDGIDAGRP